MSALRTIASFPLVTTRAGEQRSQRYLPYLVSGLLLGLSYPSYPYVRLEVLAWVWMVPMLLALKSVNSFFKFILRVYMAAFVVCVFGMSWLVVSSTLGAVLLFFIGALVFTVPFIGFYFIRQTVGWRVALWTAPVVWTAWDWLYHQSEGSFGWIGLWGSQANLYWLVQYIDITGVWGITFWLVLMNVLVVKAIEDWRSSTDFSLCDDGDDRLRRNHRLKSVLLRRLALIAAVMLLVPLTYSAYIFISDSYNSGNEISVLLVQPNIDPWHKMDQKAQAATLAKTAALTSSALARQKPDLIIWPETAVPYVLSQENAVRQFVYGNVWKWHTPLLTGTFDLAPEQYRDREGAANTAGQLFNAAVLLAPEPYRDGEGAGQRFHVQSSEAYHKQVLMPFVEGVPFAEKFPALSRLAFDFGAGGSISAGRRATVFSFDSKQGERVTVAAPICYEQLYPAKIAEFARRGADLIALITNEGWWSQTHGAYQLAAFTRLRAIETRRTIARCANTGVTCLIDPLGRIYEQAPWWEDQTLFGNVRRSNALSLYARYTDYFPKACVWLTLALALAALVQAARSFVLAHRPLVIGKGQGTNDE